MNVLKHKENVEHHPETQAEVETELELLLRLQQRSGRFPEQSSIQETAQVVEVHDDYFIVSIFGVGVSVKAKKAFSCLVEPLLHDTVLIGGQESGLYILSILERSHSDSQITIQGELSISATKLKITSEESFDLVTEQATLKSKEWVQSANQYQLKNHNFTHTSVNFKYSGQYYAAYLNTTHTVSADSQKIVTGSDKISALNLDYSAEFISRLQAQTTIINGTEILKADGKKILMG